MIECAGLSCPNNNWLHYKCAKITAKRAEEIDTYYCPSCIIPTPEPTPEPEDYKVESILGHYIDPATSKRYFLVHWEGYQHDEDTLEPEEELKACSHLVHHYINTTVNNLAPSELPLLGGASITQPVKHNLDNWVTLDMVVSKLLQFRSLYQLCGTTIGFTTVEQSFKRPSQPSLIVLLHKAHFYSIVMTDNQTYVADGANLCLENKLEICEYLGISDIICHTAVRMLKADHCGAAAIGLGLELARKYRSNELGGNIDLSRAVVDDLVQSMHPYKSSSQTGWLPVNERIANLKVTCDKCNRYTNISKKKVTAHKLACKGI